MGQRRGVGDLLRDARAVAQVRRFNRTVTQRIGVLNENFLASHRSLGQNRLLWEIGLDGGDIRSLRARLDPDSGYVSRLLRALEASGALIFHPDNIGLVKRTWVAREVRGLGLGRRLLRLETKDELSEAEQMYRTSGYREVPPFNDEPYADHWFEKPV